jgi:hypothetical protein
VPQYISDNTDDEESHQKFINGYLMSKRQAPVDLDPFRTLAPSPATGGGAKKRLTNLKNLNVDTSWYLRYRAETRLPIEDGLVGPPEERAAEIANLETA